MQIACGTSSLLNAGLRVPSVCFDSRGGFTYGSDAQDAAVVVRAPNGPTAKRLIATRGRVCDAKGIFDKEDE